jgi:methylmalonyl-CoA mutase N-terminal domain/subunit
MEALFEGIHLGEVSTSMTINATAIILLALYVSVARKQGVDASRLRGTIQNDVLKEYIARGTYIYPPAASLRIVTDLFAWTRHEMPSWNVISISGYHMREAGATATQEVAFTLANAIAYTEAALRAGLTIDDFAPRLSFFFSSDRNFLEEVAKFRAARRLYACLMKDRFGARDPRSDKLRFHAQTGGSTLTAQQPYVNVVRTAYEALAAVLGGAQSLHTNGYDEALALPTEESARLALRTQQVLAHETGVTATADPLGGSYCIEALTDEIESGARRYLERIESLGGMVGAISQGFIQREIQNAAYEFQKKVESGEQKIIGVNSFQEESGQPIPLLRIDPELERRQVARLRKLRAERDEPQARAALAKLAVAAASSGNLMPPMLEAVESYATLGEISDTLREVFGTHQDQSGLS